MRVIFIYHSCMYYSHRIISCTLAVLGSLILMNVASAQSITGTAELASGAIRERRPLPQISEETRSQIKAHSGYDTRVAQGNLSGLWHQLNVVDAYEVQRAWLEWINTERATKKLAPLTLSTGLTVTSSERAEYLAIEQKFTRMHQRPGQQCKNYWCYDLDEWFQDRGITTNVGESVLFGGFRTKETDNQTQKLIAASQGKTGGPSGFLGFLMGEKARNGVHYKMMMSSSYSTIGIGFAKAHHPSFGGAYITVLHFGE